MRPLSSADGFAAGPGIATYLIQRERVLAQIDTRLENSVAGLQEIADGRGDTPAPQTVDAFLTEAMTRVLPDHNESILGIVNGKAAYVQSSGIPYRLDHDPAFVDLVLKQANATHPVRGTTHSIWGTLCYVIIPVAIKSDTSTGLYVSAYGIDDEVAQMSQAFTSYAFIARGVLVVVGLVGWFVAVRLLRPIRLLQTAASSASQNALAERIPVTGNDDVSVLAWLLDVAVVKAFAIVTAPPQSTTAASAAPPARIGIRFMVLLPSGDHSAAFGVQLAEPG